MNIEIFSSPGCGKCGHAKTRLRQLVDELSAEQGVGIQWREVNILEEMDYAVQLGVLSTPSLAIDGELVFTSLPGTQRLRREIESRLGRDTGRSPAC
jgi:glutaredoxin